ncbi:MAG: hypothetical protein ACLVJH_04180 [Faecalibacterium prausnitzii]
MTTTPPCPDIKSAANHKEMREFAKKNDLRFHFDTNCGVCHQVMPEAGVIYPGTHRGRHRQPHHHPWCFRRDGYRAAAPPIWPPS